MTALEYISTMIEYMNENGMKDQCTQALSMEETVLVEQRHAFIFSFYTFESFFEFITHNFNCYELYQEVYQCFHKWYYQGKCDHICMYPGFFKNTDIYRYISCVNSCIYREDYRHEYNMEDDNRSYVCMNTFQSKIVVWYVLVQFDQHVYLEVFIRMPIICKQCMPYTKILTPLYDSEMKSTVENMHKKNRLTQCKATQTIDTFELCEPELKKSILRYLR